MSQECCQADKKNKPAGLFSGFVYGLFPHTFCLAFIVFSVLGATAASSLLKKLLIIPYFFQLLIAISFIFATISAFYYLKRSNCLSLAGARSKLKYILVLYGTTIGINLLLFLIVFPLTANLNHNKNVSFSSLSLATLKVNIPCSGHAPLISDELGKTPGIENVTFSFPNSFQVSFNQKQINLKQILDLEIFKSFPAKEIPNG